MCYYLPPYYPFAPWKSSPSKERPQVTGPDRQVFESELLMLKSHAAEACRLLDEMEEFLGLLPYPPLSMKKWKTRATLSLTGWWNRTKELDKQRRNALLKRALKKLSQEERQVLGIKLTDE